MTSNKRGYFNSVRASKIFISLLRGYDDVGMTELKTYTTVKPLTIAKLSLLLYNSLQGVCVMAVDADESI